MPPEIGQRTLRRKTGLVLSEAAHPDYHSTDAGRHPMSERFATTQWHVVLAARDGTESQVRGALESLCAAYWYPIYAYVRRRGHTADEARDLTQAFFADLLS